MQYLHRAVIAALAIVPAAAIAAAPQAGLVAALPPSGPTVSLKQMSITVETAPDSDTRGPKVAAFKAATQKLRRCEDVDAVAKSVDASVVSNASLPLSSIPEQLRGTLLTMPIGTATPLFGEQKEGVVRVLVLCGRSG